MISLWVKFRFLTLSLWVKVVLSLNKLKFA